MAPELKQTSVNVKVAPSMVVEEVQRTLLRKLQQTFSPEENELVSSFDFVIPGTEMILSSSEMIGSYEVVFSGLPMLILVCCCVLPVLGDLLDRFLLLFSDQSFSCKNRIHL